MARRHGISFRKKVILVILVLIALPVIISYQRPLKRLGWRLYHLVFEPANPYEREIREAAERHNIDSRLLKAVMFQESKFRPEMVGGVGEIGLMQIRPNTAVIDWAEAHGVAAPVNGLLFHPKLNIEIGAWYLAKAIQRWRNYQSCLELALCQYNAGETRANEWKPDRPDGSLKPISINSTRHYVQNIMKKYQRYCME